MFYCWKCLDECINIEYEFSRYFPYIEIFVKLFHAISELRFPISESRITSLESRFTILLRLIDRHLDEYLRECLTSDVEIDHMRTCSFDVCLIWEFDILFFEIDTVFLMDTGRDIVFIESAENFVSLSFQSELDLLTIELLLYVECLLETHASLVLCSFFLDFHLLHAFWSDFFCEFFRDEVVASLRARDFDDISVSSDIRDIDEEFDGEFCWGHIYLSYEYISNIWKRREMAIYINPDVLLSAEDSVFQVCNPY